MFQHLFARNIVVTPKKTKNKITINLTIDETTYNNVTLIENREYSYENVASSNFPEATANYFENTYTTNYSYENFTEYTELYTQYNSVIVAIADDYYNNIADNTSGLGYLYFGVIPNDEEIDENTLYTVIVRWFSTYPKTLLIERSDTLANGSSALFDFNHDILLFENIEKIITETQNEPFGYSVNDLINEYGSSDNIPLVIQFDGEYSHYHTTVHFSIPTDSNNPEYDTTFYNCPICEDETNIEIYDFGVLDVRVQILIDGRKDEHNNNMYYSAIYVKWHEYNTTNITDTNDIPVAGISNIKFNELYIPDTSTSLYDVTFDYSGQTLSFEKEYTQSGDTIAKFDIYDMYGDYENDYKTFNCIQNKITNSVLTNGNAGYYWNQENETKMTNQSSNPVKYISYYSIYEIKKYEYGYNTHLGYIVVKYSNDSQNNTFDVTWYRTKPKIMEIRFGCEGGGSGSIGRNVFLLAQGKTFTAWNYVCDVESTYYTSGVSQTEIVFDLDYWYMAGNSEVIEGSFYPVIPLPPYNASDFTDGITTVYQLPGTLGSLVYNVKMYHTTYESENYFSYLYSVTWKEYTQPSS